MRKTFKQILQERSDLDLSNSTFNTLIEIMKFVRSQTLIEVANKAEADVNWLDENLINIDSSDYEVYILKESILQLDKNSIEIYEI